MSAATPLTDLAVRERHADWKSALSREEIQALLSRTTSTRGSRVGLDWGLVLRLDGASSPSGRTCGRCRSSWSSRCS